MPLCLPPEGDKVGLEVFPISVNGAVFDPGAASVRHSEIIKRLEEQGAPGITVVEVHPVGYGFEPNYFSKAREELRRTPQIVKLEIVCRDNQVEALVGVLRELAATGLPGDGRIYHEFDLGMSVMNLMMAATHHNLVARPMAGFDAGRLKQQFNLDEAAQPLVMIAIGLPSDDESHLPDRNKGLDKTPRERKEASEIVTRL